MRAFMSTTGAFRCFCEPGSLHEGRPLWEAALAEAWRIHDAVSEDSGPTCTATLSPACGTWPVITALPLSEPVHQEARAALRDALAAYLEDPSVPPCPHGPTCERCPHPRHAEGRPCCRRHCTPCHNECEEAPIDKTA